jgi:hypothetical protein
MPDAGDSDPELGSSDDIENVQPWAAVPKRMRPSLIACCPATGGAPRAFAAAAAAATAPSYTGFMFPGGAGAGVGATDTAAAATASAAAAAAGAAGHGAPLGGPSYHDLAAHAAAVTARLEAMSKDNEVRQRCECVCEYPPCDAHFARLPR